MRIPNGLAWVRALPGGQRWLDELPGAVQRCVRKWNLTLEGAFEDCHVSLALAARLRDGTATVLKIAFPDEESEFEGAALRRWNGNGAVQLIDAHAEDRALLLERCEPGEYLSTLPPDAAMDVLCGLLPRLWVAPIAGPPRILDAMRGWPSSLPSAWERAGRPFEQELLHEALRAIDLLRIDAGEEILANQDLHAGNVLRARREPWLMIDPKPVIAEREFTAVPIVRSSELGHSEHAVIERLHTLSGALGLRAERVRLWTLLHTLLWSFEGSGVLPRHVETARWLAAAGGSRR